MRQLHGRDHRVPCPYIEFVGRSSLLAPDDAGFCLWPICDCPEDQSILRLDSAILRPVVERLLSVPPPIFCVSFPSVGKWCQTHAVDDQKGQRLVERVQW